MEYRFLAPNSLRPGLTNSSPVPGHLFVSLTFYFQMNRLIKGTARKPCQC